MSDRLPNKNTGACRYKNSLFFHHVIWQFLYFAIIVTADKTQYTLSMYKINFTNLFVIIFIAGTILAFLINQILEFTAYSARRRNSGVLPEEFKNIPEAACFDTEKLKKIRDYENAKYFSWIPSAVCGFALSLVLALSGFYPRVFDFVCRFTGLPHSFRTSYLTALLFAVSVSVPKNILSIPFDLYDEFVIEKKFGFSKMTFALWLTDEIKSLLISALIGAPLLAAVIAILTFMPNTWWIFVTVLIFTVSLVMAVIYPLVIAPLFNKFMPLDDGELKNRIESLSSSLGFKLSGIFIMDESKRSGHSNAYFGGLGKSKRIVLFDTLVKILTPDELIAVLGHELGHYKLHHIIRRFLVMVPVEFLLMLIFFICSKSQVLYEGFGFNFSAESMNYVRFVGLFLISLAASPLSELFTPLGNFFSRRDEFAADRFSAEHTHNPSALISGLIKLNSENLSELFPPKIYVIWNYSHPTLAERIKALRRHSGNTN